jgi:hypothetical protein
MWLSRTTHQGFVAGLTVVGVGATVGALASLIASKGDWLVRGPLLLSVVAYTAFKIYVFVDFMRNG